jgi:hypothetical protein
MSLNYQFESGGSNALRKIIWSDTPYIAVRMDGMAIVIHTSFGLQQCEWLITD